MPHRIMAILRGTAKQGHSEACRSRIETEKDEGLEEEAGGVLGK